MGIQPEEFSQFNYDQELEERERKLVYRKHLLIELGLTAVTGGIVAGIIDPSTRNEMPWIVLGAIYTFGKLGYKVYRSIEENY